MTREELESVIRAALTRRDMLAHDRRCNGAVRDNAFIDDALRAADAYAATTVGEFAALPPRDNRGRWARKEPAC